MAAVAGVRLLLLELLVPLDPEQFSSNEAWLFFQLSGKPVQTLNDGDFNAFVIMEVASGIIFGMELVSTAENEIPELQSRRILSTSIDQAGSQPEQLIVAEESRTALLSTVARTMGITVTQLPASEFELVTREAREGFATHVSGGRVQ